MTKSAGHTPGPWAIGRSVILVRGDCGPTRHIVDLCWDDEQGKADARLIAAAPELLIALKAMVANFGARDIRTDELRPADEQWHHEIASAMRLIAKLEGRS